MGRTRVAKALISSLSQKKESSQKRKEELINYLKRLNQAHSNQKISGAQYVETLYKKSNGRNIKEWVDYYDNYSKNCERAIQRHQAQVLRNRILVFFFGAILLVGLIYFAFSINYSDVNFTGFLVGDSQQQEQQHSQIIGLISNESTTYEWQLENPGQLSSVKINGEIEGDGEVKVYLNDILILDGSKIKSKSESKSTQTPNSFLTGSVIEEIGTEESISTSQTTTETTSTESQDESYSEQETPSKEDSSPSQEESLTETPITESTSQTTTETTSTESQDESYSEQETPSKEDSSPSQEESLTEENESEKEINQTENIESNETQEIEINETEIQTNITSNKDESENKSNISYSEQETPSKEDSSPSQEESLPETNVTNTTEINETEEISINKTGIETPAKLFTDICENTCNLEKLNLTNSSYTLRVEIEGNATLRLGSIDYEVISEEIQEEFFNISENLTINTIQYEAVLGQPVKWKKEIFNPEKAHIKIDLPKDAENIIVTKITKLESYSETETPSKEESSPSQEESLTETNKVKEKKSKENIEVSIEDNATFYGVEYETPAAYSTEEEIENGKRVKITGSEEVHYENVLVFTNLSEELNILNPSELKIYWVEENKYLQAEKIEDKNNDGFYDYVEWVVPHLSNQTFLITLQPDSSEGKDAHIDSSTPNRNFGVSNSMIISNTERILLEFDLSDVTSSANIVNVNLTLYLSSSGTGTNPILVYRINNSWIEGTGDSQNTYDGVTWTNRSGSELWALAGGDFDSYIWANQNLSTEEMFYTWDITQLVQNWVNGTYPNYGIILYGENGHSQWHFPSSDNINATIRPQLNITYNESQIPVINSVSMPSTIREGENISLTANITDNLEVANATLEINNVNYSLGQNLQTVSNIATIRPVTKGTIETNRVINYHNTYDNNNDTYAGINSVNPLLTVKTSGVSATGTINSVKIKVVHSKLSYDTIGYVHWASSNGGEAQGLTHEFNSTSETPEIIEFDVTSERNWSFGDFNLLTELHINNSDSTLRVYEAWFEINYTTPSSSDLWNATIDTSTLSQGNYTYTIFANDSSDNVGTTTGNLTVLPGLVLVNVSMNDAQGNFKEAEVLIYNSESQEVEMNSTMAEAQLISIEEGEKDIIINPLDGSVRQVEYENATINQSLDGIIDIDQPAETGNFTKVYALNPHINSTNATVTATAVGDELYKCKDWNFTEQTCYGEWVKVMDLTPGQDYNFTLSPEDPGFGEVIVIISAHHLNSTRDFISDIYEEVKELDGVWSEEIPDGDYVRIIFEKNLTSLNDITIYPRTISGTPVIEVYEVNESTLLAEFNPIINNSYNKIYLSNLIGIQDTFDLRVVGGSVQLDHIIDPPDYLSCVSGTCIAIFNTTTGANTWQIPAEVTEIMIEAWGGGGAGGQYAKRNLTVTPSSTFNLFVAATTTGGTGDGAQGYNTSFFNSTENYVVAMGGAGGIGGVNKALGAGGSGSISGSVGTTVYGGGWGYTGSSSSGGGGGGGAGTTGWGGNSTSATGGSGTSLGGGDGGGGGTDTSGNPGLNYGGGGGGAEKSGSGGTGAQGMLKITYEEPPDTTPPTYNSVSHNQTLAGQITNFAINVNDNIALNPNGGYIFSTNNTGEWVNDSFVKFSTTPSWANVTKTLNSTDGMNIGYRWFFNDTHSSPNYNSTPVYTLISGELPLFNEFSGETTDFESLPDITNVSEFVLHVPAYGLINFTEGDYNLSGADFDSYIIIGQGFVFVNSSALDSSINTSANITLTNINYSNVLIYKDDIVCADCTIISYIEGNLTFSVSGFSNYSVISDTNLSIWDDTDLTTKYTNEIVNFYANYSNISTGFPINGTENEYCELIENSTGEWSTAVNMTFNETSRFYEYNKTFSSAGEFYFNVSCYNRIGYDNVTTIDGFTLEEAVPADCTTIGNSGTLDSENGVYTLTENISSQGTCLTVSAANVTIDCAGYWINYSIGGEASTYGIVTTQSNTTVKNCNIIDGSNWSTGIGTGRHGLFVNEGTFSTLYNNFVNATNSNTIRLTNADNTNLTNNTGIGNSGYGIYVYTSDNVNLTNNIGTSEGDSAIGVYGSEGLIFINNNATTTSTSKYGLYLYSSDSSTFINNTGSANGRGLFAWYCEDDIFINNTWTAYGTTYGATIFESFNNTFINDSVISYNDFAIYIRRSKNNTFINQVARTTAATGSDRYGIYINQSNDTIFRDCINISGANYDVYYFSGAGSVNNTFINCSYNTSKETVQGDGNELIRKWYYQAYVNDSEGTLIEDANVTAYNTTGIIQFTAQTNASGWIGRQEVIEYNNTGGIRSFYNNYTIFANKSGYTNDSNEFNFTVTQNKLDDVFTLTEAEVSKFVSVWDTSAISTDSSNGTQIILPLEEGGNYNFEVDWGDGSTSTITAWDDADNNHSYESEGEYTINITGTIQGWRFNNAGDRLKLLEIKQWGPLNLGNNGSYFYNASNLQITATDVLNLSGTTTFYQGFRDCKNLTTIPSMNEWDVSEVTGMSNMFRGDSSFNQNISSWDVHNVTSMSDMFNGNSLFDQNISSWNTSKVIYLGGMFSGASSFNQPIGNWDTSQATMTDRMFNDATSFNQSLANWNTSKVTAMNSMFSDATSFNQNISNWDISKVTTIYNIFGGASSFNQPIGNWNTSKVASMHLMFYGADSFNQSLENWDTSKVASMNLMFFSASSFNQNISNWNTSNVTDMGSMFYGASSFNQNISNWNTSKVTTMYKMFSGASSFNQPIGNWDTSNVSTMEAMFYNADSFNQSLENWDTSNVSTMAEMFRSADSFNQNISSWDIHNVTTMYRMFYSAGLSTVNYNALLIGWAAQDVKDDVLFHAGSSKYSAVALDSRTHLNITHNWTITDGGFIPDPNITFEEPPTPENGSTTSSPVTIVANISSELNTSSWIDFDRSLMGYWAMDYYNATGIYDNSSYNNFGEFGAGIGLNYSNLTTGARGYGLEFDGVDDYIQTISNDLKTANNFTVSFWINPDSTGLKHIIWQGVDGQNGWGVSDGGSDASQEFHISLGNFGTDGGNDKLCLFLGNTDDANGDPIQVVVNFTNTGNWTHVVGVFTNLDSSPMGDFFLNGVLNDSDTGLLSNTDRDNWDTNLKIGRPGADVRYFDGLIDELLIFNRSLSETEILALYNSQSNKFNTTFTDLSEGQHNYTVYAINEDGEINNSGERNFNISEEVFDSDENLIAHWEFEENNGSVGATILDSSVNGNDGVLTESSMWIIEGIIGEYALYGNDSAGYVSVPYDSSMNSSNLTISAWLYNNDTSGDTYAYLRKVNEWHIRRSGGYWDFDGEGSWNPGSIQPLNYSFINNQNEWHLHTLVIDMNALEVRFYVDGQQIGEDEPFTSATPVTTGSYYLGRYSSGFRWNGGMDDYRLYNYSMTDEDVYNLFMSNLDLISNPIYLSPRYSGVSVNNTIADKITKFSINVEAFALNPNGGYIFSTNNTGEWVNDSFVEFSTTPSWANVTKTLNSTVGMIVGYRWYFNESTGNTNSTGIYELGTIVAPADCTTIGNSGTLDTENGVYTLTGNISSDGTCLTVGASNVTIDCNGYWITYSIGGANDTYGVYSNQFKTTIKNCNIIDGNWENITNNKHGIYIYEGDNSTIFNNSVNIMNSHTIDIRGSDVEYYNITNNNLTSHSGPVLYVYNSPIYGSIVNNNIFVYSSSGIFLYSGCDSTVLINNTISAIESSSIGMYIVGCDNNILTNNLVQGDFDYSINVYGSDNTSIINQTLVGGSTAIEIWRSNNTQFRECFNISSTNYDVHISGNYLSLNTTLINCSYDLDKEYVANFDSQSNDLVRKWYYQAYVNYSNGTEVVDANITAYNSTGVLQFTAQTNASGWIDRQEVTEYNNTAGTRSYYNNYTIFANKSGYANDSNVFNFTITQNKVDDWFTLNENTPPQIIAVYNSTEMTDISDGPNEGPIATYVLLNFTAYDEQGFDNLDEDSVSVNFSLAGEESRINSSCALLGDYDSYYANYTCNVTMWWWDAPGTWVINASIEDNEGNSAFNDSTTFLVGSTTGFLANSTNVGWPSINPGATNIEANYPLLLNNTGNEEINVEVNATNLTGDINPAYALGASNFSVHTAAGCGGTQMFWHSYTTVVGAAIPRGNYSVNDGRAQETIYFCLEESNANLIAQSYSTEQQGSWTIRIFLVAVTFGKRRRKKKGKAKAIEQDKLLKAINLVSEELKEEYSSEKEKVINLLVKEMKKKYRVTNREISELIVVRKDIKISMDVFANKLGALEALVKYMKENLNMSYVEIARKLGRDERTIWTAYNKSNKKHKESLKIREKAITIPIEIFDNERLTILESIIIYLKEKGKKYSEIGKLLNRDQRNIWTVYSKAIDKK